MVSEASRDYNLAVTYDIKFGMLQVREGEISLRKWSVGTAHLQLRTCKDCKNIRKFLRIRSTLRSSAPRLDYAQAARKI